MELYLKSYTQKPSFDRVDQVIKSEEQLFFIFDKDG